MIPQTRIALIAPEPLLVDRAFIRIHNKAAKDALRDEALNHWKKRIPGHFRATARGKYGYMERKAGYKAMKLRRYKSRTDLVRTGTTKTLITANEPKIRLGGKATNADGTAGQLKLTMTLTLPFGQSAQQAVAKAIRKGKLRSTHVSGEHRPGVTIAQMKKEIGVILPAEGNEIAKGFAKRYAARLKHALASRPRIRKRIQSQTSS